jgi:hypothetical protein
MSQKPETVFRAKFTKRLKAIPHSTWESIQQKTIQGTPDILGCVLGFFVGLELKATASSGPTELQQLKLERIKAAKGLAFVVHPGNADFVITLLTAIAEGRASVDPHMEASS